MKGRESSKEEDEAAEYLEEKDKDSKELENANHAAVQDGPLTPSLGKKQTPNPGP